MTIPRDRATMSTKYIRIAELAKEDKERKFFSIAHLLTEEALQEAFESLRKDASAGVDRVTYAGYAAEASENIRKLHDRMKDGQYRAQPLRRIYIPKEDGRQRPISIPSLEDKIAKGGGRLAQRDLRAGFSGVFLRIPSGARCTGRAGRGWKRHLSTAHLGNSGGRYFRILRRNRQEFAYGDDREKGP